jgi:hypothetical protein
MAMEACWSSLQSAYMPWRSSGAMSMSAAIELEGEIPEDEGVLAAACVEWQEYCQRFFD